MRLALFDFDGTITHRDAFGLFARQASSVPRTVLAGSFIGSCVLAHRLKVLSDNSLCRAVSAGAFCGRSLASLQRQGEKFAAKTIPGIVRPWAQQKLQEHREQGDRIIVVSASLDLYLEPWCTTQGFELLCSRLEFVRGLCTGRYGATQCRGREKTRLVRALCNVSDYSEISAYGDSSGDAELLEMADRKFYRGREVTGG